jgi:hypothetical protein
MTQRSFCVAFFLAALAAVARAERPLDSSPRDRSELEVSASQDFEVQGEYGGERTGEFRSQRLGWHVIALGKGQFRGVEYLGGLPGDGWDGKTRRESEGQPKGRFVSFNFPGDETRTILLVPFRQEIWMRDPASGAMLAVLRKVYRVSPTLGAPPPPKAVVLFGGRSVESFDKAQLTQDGLLGVGAVTRRAVGDFFLHLEFQTPFMPSARGQGRGNSGVYVQRRYEVQILDSFGLLGEDNECGGLYKQRKPDLNMCLPPLTWQTYDIDFRAARFQKGRKVQNAQISVRHNGVTIHRRIELTGKTGSGQAEGATPQPILLQNHGNPVRFRNIWMIERGKGGE